MSKRSRAYLRYLRSAHWKELKAERAKLIGRKACEQCSSKRRIHGHHLIYRNPLTLCTVSDIKLLCEKCHNALHRQIAKERKAFRKLHRKPKRKRMRLLPTAIFNIHLELEREMDRVMAMSN